MLHRQGRRSGLAVSLSAFPKQLRQPRDVDRDPPRLVLGQDFGLPGLGFVVAGVHVGQRLTVGVPACQGDGKRRGDSAMATLPLDALEHLGECLTTVHRCVGCPHEDGVKLTPDGLPFWVITR